MSEIVRSLLVVLSIGIAIFALARSPLSRVAMLPSEYSLRRNLWIGITLSVFLCHSFWLFIASSSIMLFYGRRHESNSIALVLSLLFAAPLVEAEITGFGVVNFLFSLNYFRLLSLLVLLPTYLQIRAHKDTVKFGQTRHDRYLLSYLILGLILQLQLDSLTNVLRIAFYLFLDVFLPYYVASRALKTTSQYLSAFASFVLASMIAGGIGVFEFGKDWLVYSNIPGALGVDWGLGTYVNRGDNLRALASTGQPIVLGFIMTVAIGFYFYVSRHVHTKWQNAAAAALLIAGSISNLSRGPWVGIAAMVAIFIATSPSPIIYLKKIMLPVLLIFFLIMTTPFGAKIIDHLPFIGTIDNVNVVYREQLLTNSKEIILQYPFFGSFDFMENPAMLALKWGGEDGIIDLVNSYLAIALSRGLVGLALFVGFFLSIILDIFLRTRDIKIVDADTELLGRTLLSTLVGILVTIYTVSSISFIPIVYWITAGLGVGYVQLVKGRIREYRLEIASPPTEINFPKASELQRLI